MSRLSCDCGKFSDVAFACEISDAEAAVRALHIAEAALVRRRVELERTHLTSILGPSCCLTIPGHACIDAEMLPVFFSGMGEGGPLLGLFRLYLLSPIL